jgi:alpha-beta hydrolase superfamily lysophospholipase
MRRFFSITSIILLAVLIVVYGGTSWYMASQVTIAERYPLEALPDSLGLVAEDVDFTPRGNEQDITLRGWLISVPEALGTVIIVHGVDSNRADPEVGYLEIADGLAERGFSSLLFDLRGHGESGGDQVSGGLFEQEDFLGAFDVLIERGIPADQIGGLGVSLGGAIVLLAAAKEPRLRALVADSTFADLSDLIVAEAKNRTGLPEWLVPGLVPGMTQAGKLVYGIDIKKIAPVEAVEKLPYPILLIHGSADDRILSAHAHRLAEASHSTDTALFVVPGAEHARTYKSSPREYIERVANYFEERFSK